MKEKPEEDYVDPQAPPRLSRRNVMAVVLAISGVLLALFFGSRRVAEPVERIHDDPIDLDVLGDRPPVPIPWGVPAEKPGWPQPTQDRADPRRLRYDEALRSRSVLHFEPAPPDTLDAQPSGHVLAEASVIEAAMITAIDSSRPGPVIAQVVHPVYDSATLGHVLVPAGTRLIGSLANMLAEQDQRVIIAWTRMVFPDGTSRDLPGFPALESSGEGGLREGVNKHRMQVLGQAALVALLGGGAAAVAETHHGRLPAAALGLELSRVAGDMLRSRRRPTITVRPGYRFLVYVSQDLIL